MSISNKLVKLQERRTDNSVLRRSVLDSYPTAMYKSTEALFSNSGLSETERYVLTSMKEVERQYTDKSFTEADRVKNQLISNGLNYVEFDFQGSVTNNTNIRYVSDIDLLVVHNGFYSIEPPNKPIIPYQGDCIKELQKLRESCIAILRKSFPEATVDSTGSKSICIKDGSLSRKVDVVPCNWFDTVNYTLTKSKIYRGIDILDSKREIRIENLPFLHNHMLEVKDNNTKGIFKQLVRLVKSIKSDMDIVPDVSSYEITALLYHMDNSSIAYCTNTKSILGNINNHFVNLYNNPEILKPLKVPNETSYIIDSLKRSEFSKLIDEIYNLYLEI